MKALLNRCWLYLRANGVVIIASIQILFAPKKMELIEKRRWLDRFLKAKSVKLLKLIKADYKVYFEVPLILEKNTPYIFMSNHQSLIDLPLIYATVLNTVRFVVKKELTEIPLFGNAIKQSEFIAVDRANPTNSVDFFQQAKTLLQSGLALWIFPEGTRSLTGKLLPFKASGFRLAREIAAKIIPVGIIGTKKLLPAKSLCFNPNQSIAIKFGTMIDTKEYSSIVSQKNLIERVQQAIHALVEETPWQN